MQMTALTHQTNLKLVKTTTGNTKITNSKNATVERPKSTPKKNVKNRLIVFFYYAAGGVKCRVNS